MSNFLIMMQWLTKYLIFCAVHLESSGYVCAKRYTVHCLVFALNMPQTRIQDVLVLNCQCENEGVGVSLFLVKSSLFAFCRLFSLICVISSVYLSTSGCVIYRFDSVSTSMWDDYTFLGCAKRLARLSQLKSGKGCLNGLELSRFFYPVNRLMAQCTETDSSSLQQD